MKPIIISLAVLVLFACNAKPKTITINTKPSKDAGFDYDKTDYFDDENNVSFNDSGQGIGDFDDNEDRSFQLNGYYPRRVSSKGGTSIIIQGRGLEKIREVYISGTKANGLQILDGFTLSFLFPKIPVGKYPLVIKTEEKSQVLPPMIEVFEPLQFDDVIPAFISENSASLITLHGKGFHEQTMVYIGKRKLANITLQDSNTITGIMPAIPAGIHDIEIFDPYQHLELMKKLTVFHVPYIQNVEPKVILAEHDRTITITGNFLSAIQNVFIDNISAVFHAVNEYQIQALMPINTSTGSIDIAFNYLNGDMILSDAVYHYQPLRNTQSIFFDDIFPAFIKAGESSQISFLGSNFDFIREKQLWFEITNKIINKCIIRNSHQIDCITPSFSPSDYTIMAHVENQTTSLTQNLHVYQGIEIKSVTPSVVSSLIPQLITIEGSGFVPEMKVSVDGMEPFSFSYIDHSTFQLLSPLSSAGFSHIIITTLFENKTFQNAIQFVSSLKAIMLTPSEGSIAGGTQFRLFGEGLSNIDQLFFLKNASAEFKVIHDGKIIGKTPPGVVSTPTPFITIPTQNGMLEQKLSPLTFHYYNPTLIGTGVFGGSIEGSMDVSVKNTETGLAVISASVILEENGLHNRIIRKTDTEGRVTLSEDTIIGPQIMTAAKKGYSRATFYELNAKHITLYLKPVYPDLIDPPDPVPPPPPPPLPEAPPSDPDDEPIGPPIIKGKIFGVKATATSSEIPGAIPMVIVQTTSRNQFSMNPEPGAKNIVFEDGGEYEIISRSGVTAVYAVMGYFYEDIKEFQPFIMGMIRNIEPQNGRMIENANIFLNIPFDRRFEIRLNHVPRGAEGPDRNKVFAFINLGREGVIHFREFQFTGDSFWVTGFPAMPAQSYHFLAGAYTGEDYQFPESTISEQSIFHLDNGIDLGPFLYIPEEFYPKKGMIIANRIIGWKDTPPTFPDAILHSLYLLDEKGVLAWDMYAPGYLQDYYLPQLDFSDGLELKNGVYLWDIRMVKVTNFQWNNFISSQFSLESIESMSHTATIFRFESTTNSIQNSSQKN